MKISGVIHELSQLMVEFGDVEVRVNGRYDDYSIVEFFPDTLAGGKKAVFIAPEDYVDEFEEVE